MYRQRYWDEVQLGLVESLGKQAEARGIELASVAVAWVLAQPGVTSAIVGASRPEQLDATLAGARLELDEEICRSCDEAWWQLPRRPVREGYR
jgi:aryl-alcohol dehydrogenase-like predicted oxidoreductase